MKTFLSSTYGDLFEHRRAVVEALQRLDQDVGMMEVFGARPAEPLAACFEEVRACDLFVGVYAHRYGFVASQARASITEQEYDFARDNNKPVFCFVISEDHPWPPRFIEDGPGRTRLAAFKERIGKDLVHDVFTTPQDLAVKVATAVGRYLARERLDGLASQLRSSLGPSNLSPERLTQGDVLSGAPADTRRQVKRLLGELGAVIDRLSEPAPASRTPVDADAVLALAQGLMAEWKWLEAAKKYEEYARLRPEDWQANYVRGVAFANCRNEATNHRALRSYNDAIAFAPPDVEPNWRARLFGYRAAILKRLGRLEEAEADLVIARRHATAFYEFNDVRYNLAAVYALRQDRCNLLAVIAELTPGSQWFRAIRAHLDDYFRAFRDDEEFLGAVRNGL